MADPVHDYALCGWHVESAISLPELPGWTGAESAPEVEFVLGSLPERLDDPVFATPMLQIDADGRALYRIPAVAAFLVEGGTRVTIDPVLSPDASDVRLFLLGSVFGLLCHQRGVLPVHAAAVDIDGEAVAFAGASGAGKSTLAAAFRRRGFTLFADDVTPIAFDPVRFLPGLRRIRLWSDSLAAASDWEGQPIERCRDGIEKFARAFDDGFHTRALTPRAIFHLRDQAEGDVSFRRLQGGAAMQQLCRQVYRWRSLVAFSGQSEALSRAARAAGAIPRHFELSRKMEFDRLDDTIDAIVATVRASR
ncbi:hypothetical protein DMC47_40010 [Nostoc sp. 3335mG]|nr:hypothetical protein DMC47_40010 [Nostoc sp. 3335mG]